MADTMKTFEVTCPECGGEFEAEIPEVALLPDADAFDIDCTECGAPCGIVYDSTTQAITLESLEEDEDDLDALSLGDVDGDPEDEFEDAD
jgi:hypothetical protein